MLAKSAANFATVINDCFLKKAMLWLTIMENLKEEGQSLEKLDILDLHMLRSSLE